MGVLTRYTATELATTPEDAAALRDVLSAVGTVDGSVDKVERTVIEGLFHTIPQLRDHAGSAPPKADRKKIVESLSKISDLALRKQCWVLAVELAIASDGINDAEDAYLESVRIALRLDDTFAAQTVIIMAVKYARSTE